MWCPTPSPQLSAIPIELPGSSGLAEVRPALQGKANNREGHQNCPDHQRENDLASRGAGVNELGDPDRVEQLNGRRRSRRPALALPRRQRHI